MARPGPAPIRLRHENHVPNRAERKPIVILTAFSAAARPLTSTVRYAARMGATGLQRGRRPTGVRAREPKHGEYGRYWARTSDLQLVELALSLLS